MKEIFFVWLMPIEGKILTTDIDMPPDAACNLPSVFQEKVKGLGGNRSFTDWNGAVEYADEVAKKTCWPVEYNNDWGREVEAMEDE